jgi:hypothetical protein
MGREGESDEEGEGWGKGGVGEGGGRVVVIFTRRLKQTGFNSLLLSQSLFVSSVLQSTSGLQTFSKQLYAQCPTLLFPNGYIPHLSFLCQGSKSALGLCSNLVTKFGFVR